MAAETDLEIFLNFLNQDLWDWKPCNNTLIIDAPSEDDARDFIEKWILATQLLTESFGCDRALIRYPGDSRPFIIYPLNRRFNLMKPTETIVKPIKNSRLHFVDATRSQVLQFIEEQREEGKLVIVSSQITSRIIDTSMIPIERGILKLPSQWNGFNSLELWRESMHQFQQLQNSLETDGYIPNFEYELLRVDGSKIRTAKDYYLARNYFGDGVEPVRISVGDFNNYEVIRQAMPS